MIQNSPARLGILRLGATRIASSEIPLMQRWDQGTTGPSADLTTQNPSADLFTISRGSDVVPGGAGADLVTAGAGSDIRPGT